MQMSLQLADYYIIAVYFLVLLGFGFIFKGLNKTTKDYFTGSGAMLWWLVGATAFMNQFSAWTFTGAAGQAYNTGFQVSILFLANALGYWINSRWSGRRMRQLNAVTPLEVVRRRYGKTNEQIFTWLRFPISLIQAGTWLSSLGVFMSSVLGWSSSTAVIICGVCVTAMTLFGGSWAVIASDYLQMLVVMVISIATAVVVLINAGGFGNIVESFNLYKPEQNFLTSDYNILPLFILWALFTTFRNILSTNNMYDGYRYLCAADTKNARKGAQLAGILQVVGAFIWFIPSWAASSMFQNSDLALMFPGLKNLGQTTYLVMVNYLMPVGMTGLLIAGVFAATMSSMDSGLNANAGIFIRNFWKPVVNKNASDEDLFKLSKIVVVVFGLLIIFVGLFINQLKGLTLFDIMLRISSLIMLPTWIPLVFGLFIKKVPDWAAWATVLVGCFVSMFCGSWLNWGLEHFALVDVLTSLEKKDLIVTWASICHVLITLPFFLCSRFFYKETGSERDQERDEVFKAFETDVVAEKTPENLEKYRFQRNVLGLVSIASGVVIGALVIVPSSTWFDRMVVICSASALFLIGYFLRKSSKVKA